jgi:molecular chaperone HscC
MPPIIGIDLGTTNSLCAVFQDGAPRLIPNAFGQFLTPSIVGVTEAGELLIGAAAKELRVTQPDRCAACFKRFMGSNESLTLAGKKYTPVELSSFVLKSLSEDARHHLGEAVTDAVITVPAYFNDNQRQATKQAGELAGLRVRRIVNEPTAAALTYGFHDRAAEKKILVIDLGGGTFDVTLMDVFEGTLEIVSTAGESFLGGEDFTDRLMASLLQKQGLQLESAELREPHRVARLRQQCEDAKRQLTNIDSVQITLPDAAGQIAADATTVNVSRAAYTKLVAPLVERLKQPIAKALRDGRAAPGDIEDVILVGGATRMPNVQDFVREFFSKEPLCKFNPDEVVALGAAIQAALIADDQAVEDLVMTDVCPFTLGIEVSKEFTGEFKQGYFAPIIHRNTTIPVSKEQIFQTIAPNQREINVVVYQGEHRRVEQNLKIGELNVTGIPPGPPGKKFYVRFTYDLNGILEVEAYLLESTRKFRTVLTQHARSFDKAELEEAISKMQALKYYPREDLVNQRLLRYCERLVGEVSPFHRPDLEAAIDSFEAAMSSGEKETVEFAQSGLLQMLSMLGYEFRGDRE